MGKISGAPRRKGAKVSGSGKLVRQQYHLGAETVKRLGVHCSLAGRDRSGVVEKVLSSWLRSDGKGREIFDRVDADDRPRDGADVNLDADIEAA